MQMIIVWMYCEILFEENMKANLQYVINTKIHINPSISIQRILPDLPTSVKLMLN